MKRIINVLLITIFMLGKAYSQQSINVSVKQASKNRQAVVKGKTAPHANIILQYAGPRGAELATVQADKKGAFNISVYPIREFEQQLVLVQQTITGTDTVKVEKPIDPIVAGDKLPFTKEQIIQILTAHRWKSVEATSQIIIRQTQPKAAFDKLLTFAQKYFRFNLDGSFDFEITQPKQFTYTGGTWTIDENNRLTIKTDYPHGVLELNNVRINELNSATLSVLEEVSDGLFLTGFVKE